MLKNLIFIFATTFFAFQLAFADDAATAAAPKRPWKNSTEVSAVSTNGNSRTTTTSAKEDFIYGWSKTALELTGSALGSSERSGTTAEEYTASEKVDYKLSLLDYVYELFSWDSNRFAGIRHQYNSSVGYGRKLIATPTDQLNGELGGGYINEQRINSPRNDFASGRAYLKYVHQFTPISSFSQDAEYLHNFSSVNGFRINTETALTATVASHVSLKVSYTWKRVNEPTPGSGKDDTKIAAALLITY
jgi:putative salt-induced outer membrane protein